MTQSVRWLRYLQALNTSGPGVPGINFVIRPIKEACLLGSPLHCDGVDAALSARRVQLEDIVERLKKMSAHEALYLLKSCFAMPRLLYLLRTAPCSLSSVTCDLDFVIRGAVYAITNVRLDADAWLQGSLPVACTGGGARGTKPPLAWTLAPPRKV